MEDPAASMDDVSLLPEEPIVINGVEFEPKEPRKGSSWLMSSLIVINAALGAGVLNFPAAFDKAGGILPATIIHVVLLLLAVCSLISIGWCSDLNETSSYQSTVGKLCGRWFGRTCAAIIALYCYGTCITFLVIVGDQTDRVFYDKVGPDFCHQYWYLNRRFMVSALSVLIMLPFCYAKNIDFLKYMSGAATVGIIYLAILSIYGYAITDTSHVVVKTRPDAWTDVLTVIPVIMFGYQCHLSVIPIYWCIEPHTIKNYIKTVCTAASACFLTYSLIGVVGYLTFGIGIKPDLLSSYSTKNAWFAVGYFIFAIKTFLAYPIILFVGRIALESLIDDCFGHELGDQTELYRRVVISTLWFATSLLVALFVPNITSAVNALGCVATLFIFFFPAMCLLKAGFKLDWVLWKRNSVIFVAGVFMCFGAFLFGLTLTQTVQYDMGLRPQPQKKGCQM